MNYFLISSEVFVLITENFWQIFWRTFLLHYLTLYKTPANIYNQRLRVVVAVMTSRILKAKQKLGVTFNSDKLGGIDFTKFSKLSMCSD